MTKMCLTTISEIFRIRDMALLSSIKQITIGFIGLIILINMTHMLTDTIVSLRLKMLICFAIKNKNVLRYKQRAKAGMARN
jgi:hypothetical protein